jgi:hypothetical protein
LYSANSKKKLCDSKRSKIFLSLAKFYFGDFIQLIPNQSNRRSIIQ